MSDMFRAPEELDLDEIDREYARRRRQVEDELMRDTNIVGLSAQIAELKMKSDAQRKRRDKLNEELKVVNTEISQLKALQSAAIDRCLERKVPPARLVEVTGLRPGTLDRRKVGATGDGGSQPSETGSA